MTNKTHPHPPYIRIWFILLAALAGSLVLGIWAGSKIMVAVIFAVAAAKAFLVVTYFMHLKFAPRWIRLIAVGAVSVVAVLYFGLIPDIQLGYASLSTDQLAVINQASAAVRSDAGDGSATAAASIPGADTYQTYCVACHQADGRGLNGKLAADFIADPSRLAKSDEELLKSIREGITGEIGQMPPWGSVLSETQQLEVLSYVRSQFGGK